MKRIPFSIIQAAQQRDSDAITYIYKHFEGFIANQCLIKQEGKRPYIDDDLRYMGEMGLYAAILKFKPQELPNETMKN